MNRIKTSVAIASLMAAVLTPIASDAQAWWGGPGWGPWGGYPYYGGGPWGGYPYYGYPYYGGGPWGGGPWRRWWW
jgi:hypothetical protein